MNILIACEFSGIVREEFKKLGHNSWSCDLLESEIPSTKHYCGDCFDIINNPGGVLSKNKKWDLMIAFPPCTHLAVSGARWFKDKQKEQKEALSFVRSLLNAPIERIALENPISIISSHIRKPDQIIQPWMFGIGETKATCLWLKNIPELIPTNIVEGRNPRVHFEAPSPDRWKNRSRTLQPIAEAMANQWGVF